MKYLLTILAIVCAASLINLFYMWPHKPMAQKDIAVTINGHQLAQADLKAEETQSGYHQETKADMLDSLITKELLIQEAQRLKIDKEENFRKTLKIFYEQSLIKILMDRTYSNAKVDVSEIEIDRYLSFFGKTVTFSRLPVSSTPPYAPISQNGLQNEVLFDDLADSLKLLIAGLEPGKHALKFDTGNEQYAIRLDSISPAASIEPYIPERKIVRNILEQNKKQQQIAEWLNELRKKASITINNE